MNLIEKIHALMVSENIRIWHYEAKKDKPFVYWFPMDSTSAEFTFDTLDEMVKDAYSKIDPLLQRPPNIEPLPQVRLITTIYGNSELLPHFLDYYSSLGVSDFVIAINGASKELADNVYETVFARSLQAKIFVAEWASDIDASIDASFKYKLWERNIQNKCDWYIMADLDEFYQYQHSLATMILKCQTGKYDYIIGDLVDRFSSDGEITSLAPNENIWTQYPYEVGFCKALCPDAAHYKVVLAKHLCAPDGGHHSVKGLEWTRFPSVQKAHHFKWRQGVLQMMKNRVEVQRKQNRGWPEESEKYLEYFQKNYKLNLLEPIFNTHRGYIYPKLREI
jgi:hypothetical protein